MPTCPVIVCDDYDTEYSLTVTYDLLEADPDCGLTSAGAEITEVLCDEIQMHTAGDARTIFPLSNRPSYSDGFDPLRKWIGQWCWETFEERIMESAATAACQYEPDHPEYE